MPDAVTAPASGRRDARTGFGTLLSPGGLILGAVFFAASLTPSLLPRDPLLQGVLAGTLGAIGHETGLLAARLWRFMELPEPAGRARARLALGAALAAAAILAFGLARAADWQNATRRVLGLAPVETGHPFVVAAVAAAVFALLWTCLRLFAMLRRTAARRTGRVLPRRVGQVAGFALALWAVWALVDGVLVRQAFRIADASFEAADALVAPDLPPPADPLKSGSAASLVAWEELGRWGRAFVATAPGRDEIAAFAPGAREPVRVYIGRRAAETPRARAEIALAELIRAGGFDRSVLVVTVPVGTGWMDPGSHDALDFMLGGDVATVAVQYSYLTSVLSLAAHIDYGIDQARELFDVIYGHWSGLPEGARPRLYVHGLSQGAFNSQRTLPILDMLADPIDGAMWAGSPFFAPYWARMREGRRPGSPAWKPRFGNDSLARAMDQTGGRTGAAAAPEAPWGPIRLVFLNYGSDPIVVFNAASAFRPPDWLDGPRAPDVAPELRWFPVVTAVQLGLDMAVSLAVPGHGHAYVARDYIAAWAELLDPPGWSPERAAALEARLARRAPD